MGDVFEGIPWVHDDAIYRYGSAKLGLMESDNIPEEEGVFTKGTVWFCGPAPEETHGVSQVR